MVTSYNHITLNIPISPFVDVHSYQIRTAAIALGNESIWHFCSGAGDVIIMLSFHFNKSSYLHMVSHQLRFVCKSFRKESIEHSHSDGNGYQI